MAISFVGTRYGRLSSSLEGRALWDELADFLGGLTDLDQLFGVMVRSSILRNCANVRRNLIYLCTAPQLQHTC